MQMLKETSKAEDSRGLQEGGTRCLKDVFIPKWGSSEGLKAAFLLSTTFPQTINPENGLHTYFSNSAPPKLCFAFLGLRL